MKSGLPPGSLVYTGDREYLPTAIYSVRYNENDFYKKDTIDDFPTYAPLEEHAVIWVDVRSLHDVPLIERLGNAYRVHPLAQEDILDTQQRAKMEEYGDEIFFILHNLRFDPENLTMATEQISIYAGANFVLSFQEDPDDTFAAVRKRIEGGLGRLRQKNSDYLMYAIIDTSVDGYFSALHDIEHLIAELETDVYQVGDITVLRHNLFNLKHALNTFRNRVLPLRDAIARLNRCESTLIEDATRPYLRDVTDHVAQVLDAVENLRDHLANIETLLQVEAGNRLNEVMRLLTVINTIFIPLTFIVGVYGMNFDNMPELHMHYAYFMVLGGMALLVLGMLVYFKRKHWI
ncbi:MAG: magnesium/cobalt transporter CorA [Saprospiraceae bacterium]|nr:magnesium/cobalt transporter CorA [Saprospiraceae bacterium]